MNQLARSNELYHHGIQGMKWGVRRYRNYDGSYTQAGMKRYNKSLGEYEKADARVKNAKAAYKNAKKSRNTNGTKTELANAKYSRKVAKAQLEKDYRHLKQDKLGDQGKMMYASGKTITANNQVRNTLSTVGSLSLSALAYNYKTGAAKQLLGIDNGTANKVLAAVGTTTLAAAGIKGVKDEYEAKRLRAYYSHTSNY